MKRQLASITAAFILGVIVMLTPILTYTQFLGGTGANTLGTSSSEQRDSYGSTSCKTLAEAAQTLGQLAATGLIAALVTSLTIKRKIKLAVQDLTTLT
jgi:hypothetical protein